MKQRADRERLAALAPDLPRWLPDALFPTTGSYDQKIATAHRRVHILEALQSFPGFGFPFSPDVHSGPTQATPANVHTHLTALRRAKLADHAGYIVFRGVNRRAWRRTKRGDLLIAKLAEYRASL